MDDLGAIDAADTYAAKLVSKAKYRSGRTSWRTSYQVETRQRAATSSPMASAAAKSAAWAAPGSRNLWRH